MARKAIVDRNTVLQLLKEGKTSQSIATQFGVSRQAIDLYRKEFTRDGLLQSSSSPPPTATPPPPSVTETPVPVTAPAPASKTAAPINPNDIPLDQMIELLISALAALKRQPQLEAQLARYQRDYEELFKQIEQLEQQVKKRKEQEDRFLQAQHGDDQVKEQARNSNIE